MNRYAARILIASLAGILAACSGGGGTTGDDVRGEISLVLPDVVPTDPGKADPGTTDPGGPTDPGTVDPGTDDPGTTVDAGADAVLEDVAAVDAPVEDVATDAPVAEVEDVIEDVTPVDPGAVDPGPTDPGPTDPGVVDTGHDTNTDPGFPPASTGSCRWLYDCVDPCDPVPAGQDCIDACLDQLTPEGSTTLDTLQTCLSDNGCYSKTGDAFSACVDEFCLDPYLHCFSGDLFADCVAVGDCMDGCPDDVASTPSVNERSECLSGCLLNATFQANWDYEMMRQCAIGACPICTTATTDAEIDQCNTCWGDAQYGACAVQQQACAVFGTDTCKTVWTCANTCGVEGCSADCFDKGSFPAQKLFHAIISCVYDACPDESDEDAWLACANASLNDGCSADYDACQADTGACAPACDGRVCGADGCGGQCGTCGTTGTCGTDGQCHTGAYPDLCAGEDTPSADACPAGLAFEGCCDSEGRVVFCNGGKLYCVDCAANQAPGNTCGWQPDDGSGGDFYNCGETGSDPSGTFPLTCAI